MQASATHIPPPFPACRAAAGHPPVAILPPGTASLCPPRRPPARLETVSTAMATGAVDGKMGAVTVVERRAHVTSPQHVDALQLVDNARQHPSRVRGS